MTPERPRAAVPADVPEILAMIRELADYERSLLEVKATEAQLHSALFGPRPAVYSHVVDAPEGEGKLAGFSLWFVSYSTWLGVHGAYLEDLFVRPKLRGRGHGRALMVEIARACVERGYGRFEWSVLDWYEPALEFYRALGAQPMSEWTVHRLTGDSLVALAAGENG